MSGAKEIRTKIGSVKNTQKITRAMEMVAASKKRKAQERMLHARPYAEKILKVISHLAKAQPEYKHPYLQVREFKRIGFIVVTTDRGLCGGLNVNLLRATVAAMSEWRNKNVEIDLCLVGRKAEAFFKRFGGHVVAQADHLGDAPSVSDVVGIVSVMLKAYDEGKLDALFIVYNQFVNTMVQRPKVQQLLPLVEAVDDELKYHWDYLYEPDAKELLNTLLTRYIESQVYQAVVENIGCEQAARMVAMKSATENAGEIIDKLQLVYNKARQSAITKELSEIVAGAAAV